MIEPHEIYHTMGMPVTVEPGDYSPHSIENDLLIPHERPAESVNIMSRIDGNVTATISQLPADFQLFRMQSYNGLAPGERRRCGSRRTRPTERWQSPAGRIFR